MPIWKKPPIDPSDHLIKKGVTRLGDAFFVCS